MLPIAHAYIVALRCFGNDQIVCKALVCFMLKAIYFIEVGLQIFSTNFVVGNEIK